MVAGSSSKVDSGELNHPAMVIGMQEAGSLLIDVEGNRLTSRFINDQGEVMDEFSIQKQNGFASNLTPCIIQEEVPEE